MSSISDEGIIIESVFITGLVTPQHGLYRKRVLRSVLTSGMVVSITLLHSYFKVGSGLLELADMQEITSFLSGRTFISPTKDIYQHGALRKVCV